MKGRAGLVLVGMAVAIVGYALVYSGLSTLNPSISPTNRPVGIIDALVPMRAPRNAGRPMPGGGGGGGRPKK